MYYKSNLLFTNIPTNPDLQNFRFYHIDIQKTQLLGEKNIPAKSIL